MKKLPSLLLCLRRESGWSPPSRLPALEERDAGASPQGHRSTQPRHLASSCCPLPAVLRLQLLVDTLPPGPLRQEPEQWLGNAEDAGQPHIRPLQDQRQVVGVLRSPVGTGAAVGSEAVNYLDHLLEPGVPRPQLDQELCPLLCGVAEAVQRVLLPGRDVASNTGRPQVCSAVTLDVTSLPNTRSERPSPDPRWAVFLPRYLHSCLLSRSTFSVQESAALYGC